MTDSYYNLTAFLGLVSGFSVVCYLWNQSGRPLKNIGVLLALGAPLIFVGAKLGYVIQGVSSARLVGIGHGYSLYGAFLAVLFFWSLVRLFWRYPFLHFLDCVTPAAAIGLVFARAGCFSYGCCGGIPTDLPWGVSFPRGTVVYTNQLLSGVFSAIRVYSLPVHPTQLYEAGLGLMVALLTYNLISRNREPGTVFVTGLLIYSSYRLSFDWLRADYTSVVGGWMSINQMISLLLLLGALTWLAIRSLASRRTSTLEI